jgi:hypothetical protein
MNAPDLKTSQMITIAYIIGIIIVLFIVYKILAAVGLVKTAAAKKQEKLETGAETALRADVYFDPYYIKDKLGSYKSLGQDKAISAATEVHDSIYGFLKADTNYEKIFSVFGRLYNKLNVSEVSLAYLAQYNRNMLADLLNNLSDVHKVDLYNIVNKLPLR